MKRPEGFGRTAEAPPTPKRTAKPVAGRAAGETKRGSTRCTPRTAAPVRDEAARFTRAARSRRRGWILGLAVTVTVIAIVAIVLFSPLFALRHIAVQGTHRLDKAAIAQAVSGQLDRPLALLDEGMLTQQLAAFPLIRSYSTEIVPPDTLIVRIVERTPVAAVNDGTRFRLVDAAGVEVDSSPTRPDGLPVVVADETPGPSFDAAVAVLLALPDDLYDRVDSITAVTRDDVSFTLRGSPQSVEWGSADNSAAKARALAALVKAHGKSGAGVYDVSASGSVVFRRG